MKMKLFVTFLAALVWSPAVLGGKVELKNGDRITGKIVKLVDGKVYVSSEMAGQIEIPVGNIKTLLTEPGQEIHLQEKVVKGSVIPGAQGGTAVEVVPEGDMETFTVEPGQITAINPPKPEKPRWKGDISAGLTSVQGNSQSQDITASFNMQKRREKDRTTLGGDYIRSEQENPNTGEDNVTENWWKLKGKYDYFFNEKWYTFFDGRYEVDKVADLERRIITGGGFGYQWIERADMNFSIEAGLAHVYEKFEGNTPTNREVSAQASYHFDKKINDKLSFINDLTYYPSIESYDDFYLTASAELRLMLQKNIFTNLKMIIDYDETPAQGREHTDRKYILGVGYSF